MSAWRQPQSLHFSLEYASSAVLESNIRTTRHRNYHHVLHIKEFTTSPITFQTAILSTQERLDLGQNYSHHDTDTLSCEAYRASNSDPIQHYDKRSRPFAISVFGPESFKCI